MAEQAFPSCGKRGLLSQSGARASGAVAAPAVEHGLQGTWALVVVGSSRTRDQTCVSGIGRRILYH